MATMAGLQKLNLVTLGGPTPCDGSITSSHSHSDSSNTLNFSTPIMAGTASFPPFAAAAPGHIGKTNGFSSAAGVSILAPPPPPPPGPASYPALLSALRGGGSARHVFLQPTALLPAESLQLVKDTLDGFAGSVSDLQLERLRAANKSRKKRKRDGQDDSEGKLDVLKIRRVIVDGFETGQVWQQAKRIIGSALEFSERAVEELEQRDEISRTREEGERYAADEEDGIEGDDDEEEDEEELGSEDDDFEKFASEDELELDGYGLDNEDGDDDNNDQEDEQDDEYDDEPEEFVEDPNGLNDGFFSIDNFNRMSVWFEDQDARGDPNTDRNSDDEDIDWTADPLMAPSKRNSRSSKGSKSKNDKKSTKLAGKSAVDKDDERPLGMDEDDLDDDDNDDDDEEEDGPTFGNMDLFAPEGASDDEADNLDANDGNDAEFNANEIYYKDFFAPPQRKTRHGEESHRKKGQIQDDDDDHRRRSADVERAMRNVRHNLYDDLSSHDDASDNDEDIAALSDASAGDPRSRRSNHERRQAKIADEIRRLEAELVAKRAWTLSGEAAATQRPIDSLLDETLDFEHAGRPVPVITTEVTESLEALIKRRIIAQEFDEVLRRRPDASTVSASTRRGLIAIDDTRSAKGLAEVYEDAHVRAAAAAAATAASAGDGSTTNTTITGPISAADEKLRADEQEAERMWRAVCARLDSLASWNYRPKNPEASVTVVADVAAVSLEDAQPSTANGIAAAGAAVLAPQEVYRPGDAAVGDDGGKEEVRRAGSGMPVARAEMSREEKTRRRRRAKERQSKAATATATATGMGTAEARGGKSRAGGEKESKTDTVAQLRRGGVAVINKKGELVGVDGKKAKAPRGATGSGFKL